jgi:hypothetical protein
MDRARTLALFLLAGWGLLLSGAGCVGRSPAQFPIDPGANFAAHQVHGGFVIDRMAGGGTADVVAPGWVRWPGEPDFVLRDGGRSVAGLWLVAPADVNVRDEMSRSAPLSGQVEPRWENQSIRLTLHPANGEPFETGLFERLSSGGAPNVLSRRAVTTLDTVGLYRAEIRDRGGRPVGWLRVRVSLVDDPARIWEGLLPPGVGAGLAAATTAALSSEIDWIQDHALDVYRGTSGGRLQKTMDGR